MSTTKLRGLESKVMVMNNLLTFIDVTRADKDVCIISTSKYAENSFGCITRSWVIFSNECDEDMPSCIRRFIDNNEETEFVIMYFRKTDEWIIECNF